MTSSVFGGRAIDLCKDGDPICSRGRNPFAHSDYVSAGLTQQAANFVAGIILAKLGAIICCAIESNSPPVHRFRNGRFGGSAAVLLPAVSPMPIGDLATASADDCPDIEVVFARAPMTRRALETSAARS